MRSTRASWRGPARIGVILIFAAIPACQSNCPPRRPMGEGIRQYFASRPTYGAMPARSFSLGSYAGYNYGQRRRVMAPGATVADPGATGADPGEPAAVLSAPAFVDD